MLFPSSSQQNALHVTFWGTRGSISTPGKTTEKYGGNTPCVSIVHGEDLVILDAGTGIRVLGLELAPFVKAGRNLSQHILLSHTHWDHIQGLPFFEPAYLHGNNLTIYGSPQKERFLESILRGQMDINYFPVQMKELAANIHIREFEEFQISIGRIKIDIQEQILHPGGSVRFRISAAGKTVVYATDVELDAAINSDQPTAKSQRLERDYRAFIDQADLLIGDGQYSTEEYKEKKGWGHSSYPVLVQTASEQNVKRVAVFHHDPEHSDAYFETLSRSYHNESEENPSKRTEVFWAQEGTTITL